MERKEQSLQYIAEEMRQASRGSFPLSPGTMSGHYVVIDLYWHFRKDILSKESVHSIFGNSRTESSYP